MASVKWKHVLLLNYVPFNRHSVSQIAGSVFIHLNSVISPKRTLFINRACMYEIHFKQDVSAEDMFLQMGPKNATTACCEYMVVAVKLPGVSAKQINLDIKEQFLDLRTPKYKLGLHLPNRVKPESSHAKWLDEQSALEVTLLNDRELDFMNF
uniref:PIH1_CS domain-containing protein n=1 Tax=Mesocestoides corti TaxID=53468 RepID=A0A5K3F6J1_MESCO